jgi:hypothetical protein
MSLAIVAWAPSSKSSGAAQWYEIPRVVVEAIEYASVWSVRILDSPKSVMHAILESSTRTFTCRKQLKMWYSIQKYEKSGNYPFQIAVN